MSTDAFDLHFLLHSADLVEAALRRRLERTGIGPRQARVIDALARMEPTSQASLAREFGVGAAAMSTMTARLIEAGYIVREVDPREARAHLLHLTRAGHDLLGEVHDAWRDVDALIRDRIGAERASALAEHARILRDTMGGHAPGAPEPSERPVPEERSAPRGKEA